MRGDEDGKQYTEGKAWPSQALLKAETGYNVQTISQALSDLCALSIDGQRVLLAVQDRAAHGTFATNRYLLFPSAAEVAQYEEADGPPPLLPDTPHATPVPDTPTTAAATTAGPDTPAPTTVQPSVEKPSSVQPDTAAPLSEKVAGRHLPPSHYAAGVVYLGSKEGVTNEHRTEADTPASAGTDRKRHRTPQLDPTQ